MRISDWSSDVCSSDLRGQAAKQHDEFLAAVARDMAMIVRNSCQRVGDRLDHAVARLVPAKVGEPRELEEGEKGEEEGEERGGRGRGRAVEQKREREGRGEQGKRRELREELGALERREEEKKEESVDLGRGV